MIDAILNFVAEYSVGFYAILVFGTFLFLLKAGKSIIKSIVAATKTDKDDKVVEKIYELMEEYPEVVDKVIAKAKKCSSSKKSSK